MTYNISYILKVRSLIISDFGKKGLKSFGLGNSLLDYKQKIF